MKVMTQSHQQLLRAVFERNGGFSCIVAVLIVVVGEEELVVDVGKGEVSDVSGDDELAVGSSDVVDITAAEEGSSA